MTSEYDEFTESDRVELIRLLSKMVAHIRSNKDPEKRDYIPDGVFEALHGINSMWAPELVVMRTTTKGQEVLLTRYNGGIREFTDIWNIPGGYNRFGEADINATVQRIALREIGGPVHFSGVIGAEKWRPSDWHPYGRPLSLFVACTAQLIEENASARFFPIRNLPTDLCGVHRRFLSTYYGHWPAASSQEVR